MRIIRNIGFILIISSLIIATSGFSIYHHICHCARETSASIILEASCNHDNVSAGGSCCSMEESHSCCTNKPAEEASPACHEDDCCQTSSQFFKINDSFQPGPGKISMKLFLVASALLFFDISIEEYTISSLNFYSADLPPPHSGKQIILALHQLKLDPSLV